LFNVFCAYKKCSYFIKNKLLACLCLLGYCVLSLLEFCKPLDLSSHFVLKLVCNVCDGTVSCHYSQALIRYCMLVVFITFK
jgi:hypothetical protein